MNEKTKEYELRIKKLTQETYHRLNTDRIYLIEMQLRTDWFPKYFPQYDKNIHDALTGMEKASSNLLHVFNEINKSLNRNP